MNRLIIFLTLAILFVATSALAHRDYEGFVGQFKRRDGATLTIFRRYTDGLMGSDPVCIYFKLDDGTTVTNTSYASDVAVKHASGGLDVYQFESSWIPIAKVSHFDGFILSDATTAQRFYSPCVHFESHFFSYLFALMFAGFLFGCFALLRSMSRGKASTVIMQIVGFITLALVSFCYLVLVLSSPISPLILAGMCGATYWLIRRIFRRERVDRAI